MNDVPETGATLQGEPLAPAAEHRALLGDRTFRADLFGSNGGIARAAAQARLNAIADKAITAEKETAASGLSKPSERPSAKVADAFARAEPPEIDAAQAHDDAIAAELLTPNDPSEYSLPGAGGDKPELQFALHDVGVSPDIASQLWNSRAAIDALDDAGYDAAVDRAATVILKRPNGEKILNEASKMLAVLAKQTTKAAAMAETYGATSPAGLLELSRIYRSLKVAKRV